MTVCLCSAQTEHMKFKGIPMEGTLQSFTLKLKAKGYVPLGTEDGVSVLKGEFAGYKNCHIYAVADKSGMICRVCVEFPKMESLSVILQVEYFKFWKKKGEKRRIFKRTPIHDNFRTQASQLDPDCKYLITRPKGAFHESKITVRFWITTIILAAMTIITLKIR